MRAAFALALAFAVASVASGATHRMLHLYGFNPDGTVAAAKKRCDQLNRVWAEMDDGEPGTRFTCEEPDEVDKPAQWHAENPGLVVVSALARDPARVSTIMYFWRSKRQFLRWSRKLSKACAVGAATSGLEWFHCDSASARSALHYDAASDVTTLMAGPGLVIVPPGIAL